MSAITPILMPKWGLAMKEGTVNGWLVDEGAKIRVGEAILEVETDKISGEVEAADPGTLRRKIASPGETLPVKALLGVLAEADASEEDIDAFIASYVVPPAGDEDEALGESPYQFIEVAGIRVRYARKGTGERTVMLVHGFGGDLDNWLFNIDALAERNTVIALDLPGHGESNVKLPGATLGELARFLARFMDALEVKSAHVVGHSLGGAIAAQMALEHPTKVDSLTLIGTAGLGEEINAGYTDGFVAAESRRDLKPVIEQLFADPTLVTRQLLDDVLKYKRLDGVGALLAELARKLVRRRQAARATSAKGCRYRPARACRVGRRRRDHSGEPRCERAAIGHGKSHRRRRPHGADGKSERGEQSDQDAHCRVSGACGHVRARAIRSIVATNA